VVGPSFYGNVIGGSVTAVSEATTIYNPSVSVSEEKFHALRINIFPNPASDLIAIQTGGLVVSDLNVDLFDLSGKLVQTATIRKGQTIAYFDVQAVYEGAYFVKISSGEFSETSKVIVRK
jgi:hypothetical protein